MHEPFLLFCQARWEKSLFDNFRKIENATFYHLSLIARPSAWWCNVLCAPKTHSRYMHKPIDLVSDMTEPYKVNIVNRYTRSNVHHSIGVSWNSLISTKMFLQHERNPLRSQNVMIKLCSIIVGWRSSFSWRRLTFLGTMLANFPLLSKYKFENIRWANV